MKKQIIDTGFWQIEVAFHDNGDISLKQDNDNIVKIRAHLRNEFINMIDPLPMAGSISYCGICNMTYSGPHSCSPITPMQIKAPIDICIACGVPAGIYCCGAWHCANCWSTNHHCIKP